MKTVRAYKSTSFWQSVTHAAAGIFFAVASEANLRRQLLAFIGVLLAAWWLQVPAAKVLILILVAAAVITFELVNSAIETLADAVHPDYSENIQRAKDMSAAAVLMASLVAVLAGLAVFVPAAMLRLAQL